MKQLQKDEKANGKKPPVPTRNTGTVEKDST